MEKYKKETHKLRISEKDYILLLSEKMYSHQVKWRVLEDRPEYHDLPDKLKSLWPALFKGSFSAPKSPIQYERLALLSTISKEIRKGKPHSYYHKTNTRGFDLYYNSTDQRRWTKHKRYEYTIKCLVSPEEMREKKRRAKLPWPELKSRRARLRARGYWGKIDKNGNADGGDWDIYAKRDRETYISHRFVR